MTREIPLSQGKVALVDDRDYDRVMEHKWFAVKNGNHWYAKRGVHQDGKVINCYLHRFVLGVPDAVRIDHRNGDGLDCTRGNLRYASAKENAWNTRIPRNNTTGFKGVSRTQRGFVVQLTVNERLLRIGCHEDAEFAALVRDAAARHFHGAFAWLNRAEPDAEAEAWFRRWLAGERRRHPNTRLTTEAAQAIRDRYAAGGVVGRELAKEYGVSIPTIYALLSGRTWKEETA